MLRAAEAATDTQGTKQYCQGVRAPCEAADRVGREASKLDDDGNVPSDPAFLSPCTDCAQLRSDWANLRIARDADFGQPPVAVAPNVRMVISPSADGADAETGVRCARDEPATP